MANFSSTFWVLMQFVYVSGGDDTPGTITPFQVTKVVYEKLEDCHKDLKNIALQPNFLGYNWKVEYIADGILIARDDVSEGNLTLLSQLACMPIKKNTKT